MGQWLISFLETLTSTLKCLLACKVDDVVAVTTLALPSLPTSNGSCCEEGGAGVNTAIVVVVVDGVVCQQ